MAPELLQQRDEALATPPPPPLAVAKAGGGGGAFAAGFGLSGGAVAAFSFDSRMSDVW